jgi:diketogulonate reductase-like aldo/keto reductase
MNQKELGKTGVLLPEIGSGTSQYRDGVKPIEKAIVLGSSLIDTAESYCTEQIVGEAVKQLRNRVFHCY